MGNWGRGRVAIEKEVDGGDGRWSPPPRQGGMLFWGVFPWLKPWALWPVPFRDPEVGDGWESADSEISRTFAGWKPAPRLGRSPPEAAL